MASRTVTWGHAKRYFEANGYTISGSGGDTIVKHPNGQVVRVGHKCSNNKSDIIYDAYLQNFRRAFGVDRTTLRDA